MRFKSAEQKIDALQSVALATPEGAAPKFLFAQPDVLHTAATDKTRARLEALGAKIFEDVQFRVLPGEDGSYDDHDEIDRWTQTPGTNSAGNYTMHDVIEQVGAPRAWNRTRGEGVTIAIVDTGLQGRGRTSRRTAVRQLISTPNFWVSRETCSSLPEGKTCVGHGVLNCEAAVQKAASLILSS